MEQKYNTRRRILVVDDYPSAAESLARRLKRFGNEVETALDGFEGIKRAEKFRPDIVCSISGCRSSMAIKRPKDARKASGEGYGADRIYGWGQEEDPERTREAGFDPTLSNQWTIPS